MATEASKPRNIMTVSSLTAGYSKLEILHDINLAVRNNHFTAIFGPNGSGKSTLLKSVFGLTRIFSGSIKLDGQELIGMATETISRCGIAYVPQRANTFTTMSVRENLRLALRNRDQRSVAIALDEAYELFPTLSKRQNQRAGQLSGGERQMLAIAIGWLAAPRVMLLDEPSAGLSPLIATEVFRTLQELRQRDITMVVVEQNARRVLNWCDNVLILREGQLVFEGTAEDCLADEEVIKEYLGVTLRH